MKNRCNNVFATWFSENKPRIIKTLIDFINIDTVTPREEDCYDFLEDYLVGAGFTVEREKLHPKLTEHKYFTDHPRSVLQGNRINIRAKLKEHLLNRKTTLINSHFDVVPATEDFPAAFDAYLKDDILYGRGACDTKNNIVMAVEAFRFLQEMKIPFSRNVLLDLVIEEEIGGNGTLSTVMHGIEADEVIVLEPTELQFFRGHRGCLTFQIEVKGKATHMGSDTVGVNAIECAFSFIKPLKDLETKLLKEAREDPDFNIWEKPLQMNIGMIKGGEWSGSVPEKCIMCGDLGFLPRYSLDEIKEMLRSACRNTENSWARENHTIVFNGLINDAYIINRSIPIVKNFTKVIQHHGIKQADSFGWKVSCDARHFNRILGLPVIIFGSGCLDDAHSANEKVNLNELEKGCHILVDYFKEAV